MFAAPGLMTLGFTYLCSRFDVGQARIKVGVFLRLHFETAHNVIEKMVVQLLRKVFHCGCYMLVWSWTMP